MVLSRMAQDKLPLFQSQEANPNDVKGHSIVAEITRERLAVMEEHELLGATLGIFFVKGIPGDPRKVVCQLIRKTPPYLAKALQGETFIGGHAWGVIETAIGIDVYEIWRNVKKGKP